MMQLFNFLGALLMLASVQAGLSLRNHTCWMTPKLHPNPNLRCGWHGPLDPSRISTMGGPSIVTDLASCASLCHDEVGSGCISFGFTDGSCQLYNRSLLNMNIAPPSSTDISSIVFYNKGCWKQECILVPQPCTCTARVVGQ